MPEMHHGQGIKQTCDNHGMTLRDWFAGMALQGIVPCHQGSDAVSDKQLAGWSYELADAMLAARKEGT